MSNGLKRVRGALLTGLAWAVIWAPVGALVGRIADPDGSLDGVWVPIGANPGFLCGVLFSAVVAIAGGHRSFDGLSLVRAGAWGAAVGLTVGALPFMIGTPAAPLPRWLLGAIVIGPIALMSTLSAMGTRAVAGRAGRLNFRDAGADARVVGREANDGVGGRG